MNSTVQILPGVRRIGWVNCSSLPRQVAMSAISGLPVALLTEINDITFFGQPESRNITEKENNGWVQSASLKFRSCDELPLDRHIAFVVTDVNGSNWLIGAYERPFPAVRYERVTGSPSGDPAGLSYEITHKALRTMIPVLV